MAKRSSPELKTDRTTHAVDFIKTDVDEVRFYNEPMIDNILTSILAISTELWSTKRRAMVLERLLEEKGVTAEMMEAYMPTDEDVAAWQTERDRFVRMVMGPLAREGDSHPSTDWPDED